MHYFHCTRGMMILPRYDKVWEQPSLKQMRQTAHKFKIDSEILQEAVQLDQIVFEKLKTKGHNTIQEAVLSGSYGKITTSIHSFNCFEDHLMYYGLRRRVSFMLSKCLQCMITRSETMYYLYKEKLMTDWLEMLDLSPNDQVRIKTGEQMKDYYKMLCMNEGLLYRKATYCGFYR